MPQWGCSLSLWRHCKRQQQCRQRQSLNPVAPCTRSVTPKTSGMTTRRALWAMTPSTPWKTDPPLPRVGLLWPQFKNSSTAGQVHWKIFRAPRWAHPAQNRWKAWAVRTQNNSIVWCRIHLVAHPRGRRVEQYLWKKIWPKIYPGSNPQSRVSLCCTCFLLKF